MTLFELLKYQSLCIKVLNSLIIKLNTTSNIVFKVKKYILLLIFNKNLYFIIQNFVLNNLIGSMIGGF